MCMQTKKTQKGEERMEEDIEIYKDFYTQMSARVCRPRKQKKAEETMREDVEMYQISTSKCLHVYADQENTRKQKRGRKKM